jgi:photosystem II stability/assembly factor-like uncharacterized protein
MKTKTLTIILFTLFSIQTFYQHTNAQITCENSAENQMDFIGISAPFNFGKYQLTENRNLWIVGGSGDVSMVSPNKTLKRTIDSNVNLNAVLFTNDTKGWIIGEKGQIFFTNDGGQNWQTQKSWVEEDLMAISCPQTNVCWITGNNGVVLRTKNSGKSWKRISKPDSNDFSSLFFISKNEGWVAGENGVILHTENGGKTWQKTQVNIKLSPNTKSPFDQPLSINFIKFTDKQNGWLATSSGIAYTKDSGKTWTVNYLEKLGSLLGLVIENQRIIAITDMGNNYYSFDGGKAWQVYCQNQP